MTRLHERYPKSEAFFGVTYNEDNLMFVTVTRYTDPDDWNRKLSPLEMKEFFHEVCVTGRIVRDNDFPVEEKSDPFGIYEAES